MISAEPVPAPPLAVPLDVAVTATHGSVARRRGEVALGGSPWSLTSVPASSRPFVARVLRAGAEIDVAPVQPGDGAERDAARLLVDRGLALPVRPPRPAVPGEVEIVVPIRGSAAPLARLLDALEHLHGPGGLPVTVVDDASEPGDAARIAEVCAGRARLVVLPENVGPGGARNAGIRATSAPVIAFLDADTVPTPGWLDSLLPHLDDPEVAVVAPRIRAAGHRATAFERFERRRGSLDMGPHARRVAPGGELAHVPGAALLARRAALPEPVFAPGLRVGEDVDLGWRLSQAGWAVRYLPGAEVHHDARPRLREWAARHVVYGTSAVPLEQRHPGQMSPLVVGLPAVGVVAGATAASAGARGARTAGVTVALASAAAQLARTTGDVRRTGTSTDVGIELGWFTLRSEVTFIGNVLRREWFLVGAALTVGSFAGPRPVGRACRVGLVVALAPTVPETWRVSAQWLRGRGAADRPLDPLRDLALRLGADAAYGAGVVLAAARARSWSVLAPRLKPWRRRSQGTS